MRTAELLCKTICLTRNLSLPGSVVAMYVSPWTYISNTGCSFLRCYLKTHTKFPIRMSNHRNLVFVAKGAVAGIQTTTQSLSLSLSLSLARAAPSVSALLPSPILSKGVRTCLKLTR